MTHTTSVQFGLFDQTVSEKTAEKVGEAIVAAGAAGGGVFAALRYMFRKRREADEFAARALKILESMDSVLNRQNTLMEDLLLTAQKNTILLEQINHSQEMYHEKGMKAMAGIEILLDRGREK